MLIIIYLFILGIFLGSFYNVVALRRVNNESIITPRSHCTNCQHQLSWYELIPIFSYIFLKGKCRKCKIHISLLYPITEVVTGLLFVVSYLIFGFTFNTLISLILVSMVVCIFITDCKYMIILDEVLITGGIFLLIVYFISEGLMGMLGHLINGIFLLLIFMAIKFLGDFVFKQESLGWGDVKLSFISGLVLGVPYGLIYIFLGSLLAMPYALYSTISKKEHILPFGPFLATSLLIIFWNMDTITKLINLWLNLL